MDYGGGIGMTLFSVRYCEWCGKQKEPINTCRCEENWTKINTNLVTAEEGDDKSVLDLLANLARRVTELERQQKENRELIIKAFEGISGKDDEYTVEERVARLERTFTEYMRRVNTIETDIEELNTDLATIEENVEMALDDIVTLDERTQPLVALVKAVKGDE
jgi:chromosome segregation ATPase